MMEGWISLHRQITENEIWLSERFTKAQAWIDLLLLATHKPRTIFIRGNEINLKPGQLCWSQLSLADRWKWNRKTVDKFLLILENREMVDNRKTRLTTIISILNWNLYQDTGQQKGQQKDNRRDTNNNGNNENNIYTQIFNFWNDKKIMVHKNLDSKTESKIKATLKDYNIEEIKTAIDNYNIILKSEDYYFTYKWTLKDFLSKGLENFIDLEIAKNNYKKNKKAAGNPQQINQENKLSELRFYENQETN
ncbi:MAG: hypothetical protein NTX22_06600 [Ignavibacteriales bacterium]|nr:hypothetical protein [Ignavibacteriales bacterium]